MTIDEKTCPRCAETIKAAAVVCRFCGHEFAAPPVPTVATVARAPATRDNPAPGPRPGGIQAAKKPNEAARVLGFGCLAFVVLAIVVALAGGGSSGGSNSAAVDENLLTTDMNVTDLNIDEGTGNAAAAAVAPAAPASHWSYDTQNDEVRGRTIYYAAIDSDNEVTFDFPYAGGSRLTMTVRKHPQYGQDVIFHISSGQFVCGVDSCGGTINFGKGPEHISLAQPADYDSESLFASNGAAIIAKLKSADKVVVELPFYQEGNRQFTFSTKGLAWPPKG